MTSNTPISDPTIPDPTAEMQRIRHHLGADANFDLGRIFAELRRQQEKSPRKYVRLPHREPTENNLWQRRGERELIEVEKPSLPSAEF